MATSLPLHAVLPLSNCSIPGKLSDTVTTTPPSPQARTILASATKNEGSYKSEVLEGLAGLVSFLSSNTSAFDHNAANGTTPHNVTSSSGGTPDSDTSRPTCGTGPGKVNFTLLVLNSTEPVFALLDRDSMQIIIWQSNVSSGSLGDAGGSGVSETYRDSRFFDWGAHIASFLAGGLVCLAVTTKKLYHFWQLCRAGLAWFRRRGGQQ